MRFLLGWFFFVVVLLLLFPFLHGFVFVPQRLKCCSRYSFVVNLPCEAGGRGMKLRWRGKVAEQVAQICIILIFIPPSGYRTWCQKSVASQEGSLHGWNNQRISIFRVARHPEMSLLALKIKKNQVAGTSFLALFIPEPTVHERELLTLWKSGILSRGELGAVSPCCPRWHSRLCQQKRPWHCFPNTAGLKLNPWCLAGWRFC